MKTANVLTILISLFFMASHAFGSSETTDASVSEASQSTAYATKRAMDLSTTFIFSRNPEAPSADQIRVADIQPEEICHSLDRLLVEEWGAEEGSVANSCLDALDGAGKGEYYETVRKQMLDVRIQASKLYEAQVANYPSNNDKKWARCLLPEMERNSAQVCVHKSLLNPARNSIDPFSTRPWGFYGI